MTRAVVVVARAVVVVVAREVVVVAAVDAVLEPGGTVVTTVTDPWDDVVADPEVSPTIELAVVGDDVGSDVLAPVVGGDGTAVVVEPTGCVVPVVCRYARHDR